MNEKLPVLQEAIKQLKEKEKTDLADELHTLVEELFVQIENKKERAIKKSEQKIDDFLNDHEKDIQIGNWKDDLAILAAEVSSTATDDTDEETPETEKKWRRSSMSSGRKKFRKRTGIATVVAWIALFAWKIKTQNPSKQETKTEITADQKKNNDKPSNWPDDSKEILNNERQLPYPPPKKDISSRFGEKRKWYIHKGTDIPLPEWTPIYPVLPGVVTRKWFDKNGWNYVVIEHTYQWTKRESKYMHLKNNSPLSIGRQVASWQTLGLSGNTWRSTWPHLHIELRKDGKVVNPCDHIPLTEESGSTKGIA
jgi:murein DD-endopeptidase MepM/ murein hydrolase activator NlpD